MKMYLVQRMRFNYPLTPERRQKLFGRDPAILDPDYMGSAEFEFGAVGNSFRRILDNYENYVFVPLGIENKNKVPIWVYCEKSKESEVRNCIMEYIAKPYQLKEWIHLRQKLGLEEYNGIENESFWWDIEHDFMFFIGGIDRMAAIKAAMFIHQKEYKNHKSKEIKK